MPGYRIADGFIDLANIDFHCPNCDQHYSDDDDKYLDRCNNNKSRYTTITCERCEIRFGMTYDITGTAVGFKL